MQAARHDILPAAFGGALIGASLGWPAGWFVIQLTLTLLFSRLFDLSGARWEAGPSTPSKAQARSAAGLLAIFVFFLYAVGFAGFPSTIDATLRPWTMLIAAAIALAQAAIAGLVTYAAFRLALTRAMRLLGVMPALWVAREFLTLGIDAFVPWLAIGYAQAPAGPFAGLFPLGGVYLVGWASVASAAALAIAWHARQVRLRLWLVTTVVASVAASFGLGAIDWTRPSGASTVQLVQTGEPHDEDGSDAVARRSLTRYAEVIATSSAALIVTPQLALPKIPQAVPPAYLADLTRALNDRNADILLGSFLPSDKAHSFFNGVQVLGASGAQRYRKHFLFPYGEYLPFGDAGAQWVNARLAVPRTGTERGPLAQEPLIAGGLRLAVLVCYEIAFGDALREQAASAEAIVVLASDAAHDSASLARQTRQIGQARALEFQKPLARSSDVAGSYFIERDGVVSAALAAGVADSLVHTVHGRSGLTPYGRWGDALVAALLVFVLLVATWQALAHRAQAWVSARRRGVARWTSLGRQLSQQSGQVLPVSLALLVVIAVFFFFMVNTGQMVTEKMRVTNAADAAAYSAAVVEARALNYDAYLNRAMLADQLAIAQMVSFASWINYYATATDNFALNAVEMNFMLLPNLDMVWLDLVFGGTEFAAAYFGGGTVHEYADKVIPGFGVIATALDAASVAMSASQIAVQANLVAGVRQGEIADQVVKAMDPALTAEVVLVSHGFDLFTKNYSGDERTRFADVTMRSRDDFTRERNFQVSGWDIPFWRNDAALKKRGGTDLVGLDEWKAVDTLELHGEHFGCIKKFLPTWCDDIKTPIGWGGYEVDSGGDKGHVADGHGHAYIDNPTTAARADAGMLPLPGAVYTGLPRSQDLRDVDPTHTATTGITVMVSKTQGATLTSGNAATVKPAGSIAVFDDHPAGGQMIALGRAQVYFDRIAARGDAKIELGSLYNPYWRVRLVSPTVEDRAYAATKQGGLFMPPLP